MKSGSSTSSPSNTTINLIDQSFRKMEAAWWPRIQEPVQMSLPLCHLMWVIGNYFQIIMPQLLHSQIYWNEHLILSKLEINLIHNHEKLVARYGRFSQSLDPLCHILQWPCTVHHLSWFYVELSASLSYETLSNKTI